MIYIFLTAALTFITQAVIFPVFGVRADLILVCTVYYGFLYGCRTGAGIGMAAGLLQDIFSGGMPGLSCLSLFVSGLLSGLCGRMFLLRYGIIRISLVFVFSFINLLIYLAAVSAFSHGGVSCVFKGMWAGVCVRNTLIAAVFSLIADRGV